MAIYPVSLDQWKTKSLFVALFSHHSGTSRPGQRGKRFPNVFR
ncbi:hypothetical protein B4168_1403 [Anoxybacillus flavithermus]|nr:hypothetical protein B4168_1403 [Anoxybacillus flavithermus]OAO84060.1 hypothetical protein GT23_3595 [Parageobacillus thermoglucosidasius]